MFVHHGDVETGRQAEETGKLGEGSITIIAMFFHHRDTEGTEKGWNREKSEDRYLKYPGAQVQPSINVIPGRVNEDPESSRICLPRRSP